MSISERRVPIRARGGLLAALVAMLGVLAFAVSPPLGGLVAGPLLLLSGFILRRRSLEPSGSSILMTAGGGLIVTFMTLVFLLGIGPSWSQPPMEPTTQPQEAPAR
ncbi:hypothetical protein BH23CHL4_BH23CHL4_30380 [soil metagenome]